MESFVFWNTESKHVENLMKFASILYLILFSTPSNSFSINLTILQKHISEKKVLIWNLEKKKKS